ncbi:MAG: B12-binding domain-containing radical SAM protein [Candidatus Brocadiae bacterium]|nr:B12-binding domain-containing radical SAM protein [Candidatus Brocadiia bacterium]
MGNILLIQPPIQDFYLTAKRTIPYGLASIASALEKTGFSVQILDAMACSRSQSIALPKEMAYLKEYYGKEDRSSFALFHQYKHYGYSFEDIARETKATSAFLVGISSLFTAYSDQALQTARIVRQSLPKAHIVMGGHHPTALPEKVMEEKAIDFCIRGEGEISLPLLATALQNQSSLDSIPGLVFRKPDGSLHISEPCVVKDLDSLSLPSLHLIQSDFYYRGKNASAVVVASRGCPLQCSYCSLGAHSCLSYRRRSLSHVIREIEIALAHHPVLFLDFEDENISFDRTFFLALLKEIQKRFPGRLELRAMNGLYPPTLDEEIVYEMKQAGFKELNLSLVTLSPEQLKKFRRANVKESFEKIVKYALKIGLSAVGYIIVSSPGQDPHSSLHDLLYLAKNNVLAGVSVYYPAPDSLDYQICKEKKLLPAQESLLRGSALPISDSTSRLQSITFLRLSRVANFMKALKDKGIEIPQPEICSSSKIRSQDRLESSKELLSYFFQDYRIRGVTSQGEIYIHKADTELCKEFAQKILTK